MDDDILGKMDSWEGVSWQSCHTDIPSPICRINLVRWFGSESRTGDSWRCVCVCVWVECSCTPPWKSVWRRCSCTTCRGSRCSFSRKPSTFSVSVDRRSCTHTSLRSTCVKTTSLSYLRYGFHCGWLQNIGRYTNYCCIHTYKRCL